MRVVFWYSEHLERERRLAGVLGDGVRGCGDLFDARVKVGPPKEEDKEGVDCAIFVGVKNRKLFKFYRAAGVPVLYMDKPYFRETPGRPPPWHWRGAQYWMWRVSLNSHQPVDFLEKEGLSEERWNEFRVPWVKDWQKEGEGNHVIWAGSSTKYHEFHGLLHPTKYAEWVVEEVRKRTDRPIIYRPKPSWHEATPIFGTRFENKGLLQPLLKEAHCLITHGSSACVDAVLAGVPTIILGEAVTKKISSTDLGDVVSPRRTRYKRVLRLMHSLAWCQWSLDEIQQGEFWDFMKRRVNDATTG